MALDERRLYENILRRDRRILGDVKRRFSGATEAQRAASALETENLLEATGVPEGVAQDVRGVMSEEAAAAVADAEAAATSAALKDLQGPERLAEVEKEAADATEKILKDIDRQETGGAGVATGLGLAGGTLAAIGSGLTASGLGAPAGIPLQVVGSILGLGGGAWGAGISGAAASEERQKALKDIRTQASEFKAPSLAGYERMLSSRPGYGGINTQWLGGQSARRRRPDWLGYEDPLYEIEM
tara:strand:+ start:355 stop:1083 length:729 start_codon:yes stop_codon:yes gene_type:complete